MWCFERFYEAIPLSTALKTEGYFCLFEILWDKVLLRRLAQLLRLCERFRTAYSRSSNIRQCLFSTLDSEQACTCGWWDAQLELNSNMEDSPTPPRWTIAHPAPLHLSCRLSPEALHCVTATSYLHYNSISSMVLSGIHCSLTCYFKPFSAVKLSCYHSTSTKIALANINIVIKICFICTVQLRFNKYSI